MNGIPYLPRPIVDGESYSTALQHAAEDKVNHGQRYEALTERELDHWATNDLSTAIMLSRRREDALDKIAREAMAPAPAVSATPFPRLLFRNVPDEPGFFSKFLQGSETDLVDGRALGLVCDVLLNALVTTGKEDSQRVAALEARIAILERKPNLKYCGVYDGCRVYGEGDAVTCSGSLWIAKGRATQRPDETDDGAREWTLAVKRGRDGRDIGR
jgi:hypothetical protein